VEEEEERKKDVVCKTTETLMHKFKFVSISTGFKDEIWFYENGIWKLKGKEMSSADEKAVEFYVANKVAPTKPKRKSDTGHHKEL